MTGSDRTVEEAINKIQDELTGIKNEFSSPEKDKNEFLIETLNAIELEIKKSKPFPLGNMLANDFCKARNKILAEIFLKKSR